MTQIYLSTSRTQNLDTLFRTVCAGARESKEQQLIIVPEQFSHSLERSLCEMGGDTISRYAEILGFSRLAVRVFSEYGGVAETETDAAGRLLIMALTVEQLRSRLKLYGSKALKPNFLLQLSNALEELSSAGVNARVLREKLPSLSGAFAEKMEELSLLLEGYNSVCANLGQNSESRLSRLLLALEQNSFAKGRRFFFYGFTDFNGVELDILQQLMADGAELHFFFLCDELHSKKGNFATAANTARILYRMAQKFGKVELQQDSACEESSQFSFLRSHLFDSQKLASEKEDAVVFLDAPNPMSECRMVAGEILRLVEQGVRYRDITIACADYQSYCSHLKTVFHRAGIPGYFAGDTDILRQPVAQMLLSALDAALSMDGEAVIQYLKFGYSGLSMDQVDLLENYIRMWDISGSRFREQWSMSTKGVAGEKESQKQQRLAELNTSRQKMLYPLQKLRDSLLKATDTAQMILAVDQFMEDIRLNDKMNQKAKELFDGEKHQKAQEYAQVYSIFCRLMEQIYGVLGNTVRSTEDFCLLLRTALGLYTVGTIPATLDCVSVGSVSSQRNCNTDYLFVVGANEGSFPSVQNNQSLLNDRERTQLIQLDIRISPTTIASGRLERELSMIDSVLAAPIKKLYFSALEGKQSYFVLRANHLFPQSEHIRTEDALISRSPRDHHARYAKREEYHFPNLSQEAVEQLYGKELQLSSSKIETFANCRFSYFLKYGLRADELRTASVDASTYGTFVHYVLEHTTGKVMEEGGFQEVSLDRVLAIADELMEYYTVTFLSDLWYSERAEYLFRRNFADIRMVITHLYEELSAAEFRPEAFELTFGRGEDNLPPVRVDGDKVTAYIEGKVDRMDVWRKGEENYIRVVDYKTGRTTMDYTRLFHGLGMQMLIYLFALKEHGVQLHMHEPIPAGVLYFPARVERISIHSKDDEKGLQDGRAKAEKHTGILLEDEDVLRAMDPSSNMRFLPCDYKKDRLVGDLASKEQLDLLEQHITQKIRQIADGIYEGILEPDPYYIDSTHEACAWCPYETVCGKRGDKRILPKMKLSDFWSGLEVEYSGN